MEIAGLAKQQKNDCPICGKELIYSQVETLQECSICKEQFSSNVSCADGHYICDGCHTLGADLYIEKYCLNSDSVNPIEMATEIMRSPQIKMHGPEHHQLVPAVLLTAYSNRVGERDKIGERLKSAQSRGARVSGGFCGMHGNCGAAVGTGIFWSIISGATPLSGKSWQQSNTLTARSLLSIAESGGPRCCKRDSLIAIQQTAIYLKKEKKVELEIPEQITCEFSHLNKQCLKRGCRFYVAKS